MLQIVGFVFVLALVYAIKVVVVMRAHEELVEDCATFSWMSAHPEDQAVAESWTLEEEPTQAGVVVGGLRPATGAHA